MEKKLKYHVLLLITATCTNIIAYEEPVAVRARNPHKYVIGAWPGGMGMCLNAVLNHITMALHSNKTPTVHWDRASLYYEHGGFNGSQNVWEYYFEPISALKYEPGDPIHLYENDPRWYVFLYWGLTPEKRQLGFKLMQRYIRFKPAVQNKIDQFYNQYMAGKETIGIHIRGTDKVQEEKPVSPERMVEAALEHASEHTQFLIATDEQKLLTRIIQLLRGRKVIYYDCYRSPNNKPLHIRKPPSRAQSEEDVLVEMSLLSKCNLFIHTPSNVGGVVLYMNPDLQNVLVR